MDNIDTSCKIGGRFLTADFIDCIVMRPALHRTGRKTDEKSRKEQILHVHVTMEITAQLSLGLADRTHGAHSQPASITVRV